MMLVGNYGFEHRVPSRTSRSFAVATRPIAGNFVRNGVLLLMVNAAVLGTTAISLAQRVGLWRGQRLEHSPA